MELDVGDDLRRVRDADIVVSVTGTPGILGPDHLRPHHRFVVDSGFVPQPDGSVKGGVQRAAYDISQHLTPVPGGIGPVEMATLTSAYVTAVVAVTPKGPVATNNLGGFGVKGGWASQDIALKEADPGKNSSGGYVSGNFAAVRTGLFLAHRKADDDSDTGWWSAHDLT
ncbi:hypothetical protein [Streptomyces tailanensis]|uniref:hypothetical protein n=1 Tax=Streptomyces tailanensis TaxID=2569858 RepID=UPI00122E6830|nr:hypothetical protein [Streptomyces tailanensis]